MKIARCVLFMIVLPVSAMAQTCGGPDRPGSCPDGTMWDEAAGACVSVLIG